MSDEMDECACFWSHEFAMRRLLALIRQGQSYCTDTECIDLPSLGGAQQSDDSNNFTMISMLLIFAVIMYLFRPNSLRRNALKDNQKSQQPPSSDGQGPDAPPAVN